MLALSLGSEFANALAWLVPFCAFLLFTIIAGARRSYTWLCLVALALFLPVVWGALVVFVAGGLGIVLGILARQIFNQYSRRDQT